MCLADQWSVSDQWLSTDEFQASFFKVKARYMAFEAKTKPMVFLSQSHQTSK